MYDNHYCFSSIKPSLFQERLYRLSAKVLAEDFLNLLSYTRFLNKMSELMVPMCAYFQTVKGESTGIAFVDYTSLKVCHNIRIPRNKVFNGIAKRGKGTMG